MCLASPELPVRPKVQFLQVNAAAVADVSEVSVASVDELYIAYLFCGVELLFVACFVVVLGLGVLVL